MSLTSSAYSRTWESAKNRYLRTIVKDLSRYRLEEGIIRKIQNGLVAQSIRTV